MSSSDLLQNFKYFYTCRVLTEKEGWFKFSQKCNLVKSTNWVKVPQFKLKIMGPGTSFIQLRQLGNFETTFKGNNKYGFKVSDEHGEKMKVFLNKRANVYTSKIAAYDMTKGQEVYFDKSHSYPKVFTLTVFTNAEPIT